MEKKICLIGCGGQASSVYAPSLQKYRREEGGVALAACCDVDRERAEAFRQAAGFARTYTDYHQMLDMEKPDAVILVTPYMYTAGIAVDVIAAGCQVMIEKPPGNDLADCMRIAEAVKLHDPIHFVAFNRRHIPMIREMMRWLGDGEAPLRIQHIDYKMYRVKRAEPYFHTTAIHGIDLVRFVGGADYRHLDIQYQRIENYGGQADNMLLQGVLGSGTTVQLSFCPVSGLVMERIMISADDHMISVDLPIWNGPDFPGRMRLYRDGALIRDVSGDALGNGPEMFETNGFYAQLHAFFACVKEGRKSPHDIASSLNAVAVSDCLAARKAIFHQPV